MRHLGDSTENLWVSDNAKHQVSLATFFFFQSKMQEGTSVSQHLDKMEKIFEEFVAVRVKMTDCNQWPQSLLGKVGPHHR